MVATKNSTKRRVAAGPAVRTSFGTDRREAAGARWCAVDGQLLVERVTLRDARRGALPMQHKGRYGASQAIYQGSFDDPALRYVLAR